MTSAEVQASDANDSGPPYKDHRDGSVFDFLYHDARRVGSFLAQFETHGVPSQVKATESTGRSEGTRTTGGLGFNALTFANAQAARDVSTGTDERDTAERTYDPLWTNARTLLDYLATHDMIHRDLWEARIGQFVLAKGFLIVLDVAMLKTAWQNPAIKRIVLRGVLGNQTPPSKNQGKAHNSQKSDAELLVEMLPVLPHSLQAHVIGENYSAWCSLADASLVGMSSDVVLKHGALVPGDWHILGILDATPDAGNEPPNGVGSLGAMDSLVAAEAGTTFGTMAAQLAPIARQLMGRPAKSFGMTPLLVFREVSG